MSRPGRFGRRAPDGLIDRALTGASTVGRFAGARPARWKPGRRLRVVGRLVLAMALAASLATASSLGLAAQDHYVFRGLASAPAPRAADFALMAHTGHRVRLRDFRGKTVLLYFGYTSCPGICPTTLAEVNQALRSLGPTRARRVQFVMVTVDPERDTRDKLAAYVTDFNRSFLGLTGTPDEIAAVAARYGVYYRRIDGPTPENYLIDHTSVVIVVDGVGYVRVLFPHGTPLPDMVADLDHLVR